MTTHEVLEIIDEHKEMLPDGVYKKLCDKMASLNEKKKTGLARCEGILISTYSQCCGGTDFLDERVTLLLNIEDSNTAGNFNFESGTVGTGCFKKANDVIEKHGYAKFCYNMQKDSYILIQKFEMMEP